MSFELTTDEAFLVYAAIADHAWDSDLGKLATQIYNHYHSQPRADWVFPMIERAVLTLFPEARPLPDYMPDSLSAFACLLPVEKIAEGRSGVYTSVIKPLLDSLSATIPTDIKPTHYDIGVSPDRKNYSVSVELFVL